MSFDEHLDRAHPLIKILTDLIPLPVPAIRAGAEPPALLAPVSQPQAHHHHHRLYFLLATDASSRGTGALDAGAVLLLVRVRGSIDLRLAITPTPSLAVEMPRTPEGLQEELLAKPKTPELRALGDAVSPQTPRVRALVAVTLFWLRRTGSPAGMM